MWPRHWPAWRLSAPLCRGVTLWESPLFSLSNGAQAISWGAHVPLHSRHMLGAYHDALCSVQCFLPCIVVLGSTCYTNCMYCCTMSACVACSCFTNRKFKNIIYYALNIQPENDWPAMHLHNALHSCVPQPRNSAVDNNRKHCYQIFEKITNSLHKGGERWLIKMAKLK